MVLKCMIFGVFERDLREAIPKIWHELYVKFIVQYFIWVDGRILERGGGKPNR
jgi:hypothetical protein